MKKALFKKMYKYFVHLVNGEVGLRKGISVKSRKYPFGEGGINI